MGSEPVITALASLSARTTGVPPCAPPGRQVLTNYNSCTLLMVQTRKKPLMLLTSRTHGWQRTILPYSQALTCKSEASCQQRCPVDNWAPKNQCSYSGAFRRESSLLRPTPIPTPTPHCSTGVPEPIWLSLDSCPTEPGK